MNGSCSGIFNVVSLMSGFVMVSSCKIYDRNSFARYPSKHLNKKSFQSDNKEICSGRMIIAIIIIIIIIIIITIHPVFN